MKWRPMSITKKFEIKETSIAQKQNSKAAGKAATVIDKLPPGAINKCGAYSNNHATYNQGRTSTYSPQR